MPQEKVHSAWIFGRRSSPNWTPKLLGGVIALGHVLLARCFAAGGRPRL
jgi:hypothetical protein